MSDFLDRVATRAVGSESMLSPRLPSLFEPARRGSAAVAEESLQIQDTAPEERSHTHTLPHAQQPEGRATPAMAPVLAFAPRPARETTMQAAPRERLIVAEEMRLAAPAKSSPHASAAKPVSPPTAPRAERTPAGELQPVRETHILRERIVTEPSRNEPLGVLLPPNQSVFATRHDPEARAANPARPPAAGPLADASRESREPVVHVSIGRLEVRAAPAGAPAPRRQEAPRASALDDYLRQRGGSTL